MKNLNFLITQQASQKRAHLWQQTWAEKTKFWTRPQWQITSPYILGPDHRPWARNFSPKSTSVALIYRIALWWPTVFHQHIYYPQDVFSGIYSWDPVVHPPVDQARRVVEAKNLCVFSNKCSKIQRSCACLRACACDRGKDRQRIREKKHE